ncbi:hypothetical protein LH51_16610 [Nitrincola sp. A-D6]|uniref:hypothetical protein n=1 Tax=Nitrincola sp. A-D6 TaxID=1545442 RepID=UPI00051F8F6C|nr:hypothetical protein [Nitrincola sp. A-D6]KGK41219.1 hypothetical protein LH51_16610 [Nitrincola sp. A-D6]
MRKRYSDIWDEHSIYPEVFVEDEAWMFTSHHFPINDEVKGWLDEQRKRTESYTKKAPPTGE